MREVLQYPRAEREAVDPAEALDVDDPGLREVEEVGEAGDKAQRDAGAGPVAEEDVGTEMEEDEEAVDGGPGGGEKGGEPRLADLARSVIKGNI